MVRQLCALREPTARLERCAEVALAEFPMRKLLFAGLGLCAIGALWKVEEEEDGVVVALSPFLAALAIEVGVFLLRRHQGSLLGAVQPANRN